VFKENDMFESKWFITNCIRLGDSTIEGAGIGVFAIKDLPARTVIEASPVIVVHKSTFETLNDIHPGVRNILSDYPFAWPGGCSAIAMGWGGVYNHSFMHNVMWEIIAKENGDSHNALRFRTKRDIVAGEELFIRYTWTANNLWFIDNAAPPASPSLRDQLASHGSMGMKTERFFADAKYLNARIESGKETLGDYELVTKNKIMPGDE
jgi:hypothetical protein